MLKTILLASAMTIAVPAMAQTASTGGAMPADQSAGTATTGTTSSTTTTTAPNDSTMSTTTSRTSRRSSGSSTMSTPSSTTTTDTTTGTSPATPSTDPSQPQTDMAAADTTGAATADATATAQAQPANGSADVGSVIDQEFASYDKDGDGQLSKTEFSAWMDALKAKQPANAAAMSAPGYNAKAFAQADTDKSAALSKGELTTFLSGGKSSS